MPIFRFLEDETDMVERERERERCGISALLDSRVIRMRPKHVFVLPSLLSNAYWVPIKSGLFFFELINTRAAYSDLQNGLFWIGWYPIHD
jgi:hypothetical protein